MTAPESAPRARGAGKAAGNPNRGGGKANKANGANVGV